VGALEQLRTQTIPFTLVTHIHLSGKQAGCLKSTLPQPLSHCYFNKKVSVFYFSTFTSGVGGKPLLIGLYITHRHSNRGS